MRGSTLARWVGISLPVAHGSPERVKQVWDVLFFEIGPSERHRRRTDGLTAWGLTSPGRFACLPWLSKACPVDLLFLMRFYLGLRLLEQILEILPRAKRGKVFVLSQALYILVAVL